MKTSSSALGWFVAGIVVCAIVLKLAEQKPAPPPPRESLIRRCLKHPLAIAGFSVLLRELSALIRPFGFLR